MKQPNPFLAVAVLASCFSAPCFASEISLGLSKAVATDPRILSARASLQSRQTEAEGAFAVYLPTVRGVGSAGSSRANDPLIRDGSKRTYGMEIEQPIPIFGRESARVELARVAVKVEMAEVRRVEQSVLGEALEALCGSSAAHASLALRRELLANFVEQTALAREAVTGGGMKLTEERQLLSRKAQAQALLTRAEAELAAARLRLLRIFPQGESIAPSPPALADFWNGPLNEDALISTALERAPGLLRAKAETEQAIAEHEVARADFWPKLSLVLQGIKGSFGPASADTQSAFLGVTLPLFEGGATVTRAESAAYKASAAREKTLFEEQMTRQHVAEAYRRWQAGETMVEAWQDSERQEAESVALIEAQLADGGATQFALLRARQARLEALLQGVDYRLQREQAWIRLLQEIGVLTVSAIQEREE